MRQNWRECQEVLLKQKRRRTMCLTIYAGLSRNTDMPRWLISMIWPGCGLFMRTANSGGRRFGAQKSFVPGMDTPSSCRERRLSNNKEETQWRNTPTIPTAHGKNRPLLLPERRRKNWIRWSPERRKRKRKARPRRFLNIFAPDDAENVKSSILSDVIVPGVKAAIADVISIVLFGDTGRIGQQEKRRFQNCLPEVLR